MRRKLFRAGLLSAAITSALLGATASAAPALEFEQAWSQSGQGSEIVAIDAASGRVFNTYGGGVEVRDITTGNLIGTFTVPGAGGVNSVAVSNGVVAIAAEAPVSTDTGFVAFYDANDADPDNALPTNTVAAGALPDMVTFTPNGMKVLVANEGEPNDAYTVDPEGSVTVIDISGGVGSASATQIDFNAFDGNSYTLEADGLRIFGPGASVSQDLEPEYITVSPDGNTAFVTLQENNAIAKIDLATNTVTELQGLGTKDHSLAQNSLDASNDDGIDGNLQTWPVLGMYQPDAIDSYVVGGQLYYVTANEGDARDYAGYSEEQRVRDLSLDLDDDGVADTFSPLQDNDQLGRLKTTSANGDLDNDGLYEKVYSYGARSFSIWDADGNLVADTGNTIESVIFNLFPGQWEDGRSDDKGPEPEAIKIIELDQFFYALVGLERTGGFMLFDITDPSNPMYMDYIFNAADEALEGIDFELIADAGRNSWGWLAVSNEDSNTTTFYRVSMVPVPATLALLGLGALVMRRRKA